MTTNISELMAMTGLPYLDVVLICEIPILALFGATVLGLDYAIRTAWERRAVRRDQMAARLHGMRRYRSRNPMPSYPLDSSVP